MNDMRKLMKVCEGINDRSDDFDDGYPTQDEYTAGYNGPEHDELGSEDWYATHTDDITKFVGDIEDQVSDWATDNRDKNMLAQMIDEREMAELNRLDDHGIYRGMSMGEFLDNARGYDYDVVSKEPRYIGGESPMEAVNEQPVSNESRYGDSVPDRQDKVYAITVFLEKIESEEEWESITKGLGTYFEIEDLNEISDDDVDYLYNRWIADPEGYAAQQLKKAENIKSRQDRYATMGMNEGSDMRKFMNLCESAMHEVVGTKTVGDGDYDGYPELTVKIYTEKELHSPEAFGSMDQDVLEFHPKNEHYDVEETIEGVIVEFYVDMSSSSYERPYAASRHEPAGGGYEGVMLAGVLVEVTGDDYLMHLGYPAEKLFVFYSMANMPDDLGDDFLSDHWDMVQRDLEDPYL